MPTVNSKLTDYSANFILQNTINTLVPPSGSTVRIEPNFGGYVYLGLSNSSTDPTDAGGNFMEPTATNYARIPVGYTARYTGSRPSDATSLENRNRYFKINNNNTDKYFYNFREIYFNKIKVGEAANWGTIKYIGLFDAQTGGHLLWWGQIDPTIPASAQETIEDHIIMVDRYAIKVYMDDGYTPV